MHLFRPGPAAFSVVLALVVLNSQQAGAQQAAPDCRPAGELARMQGLSEASGVALSGRTPGRLWAHNDSGDPVIFALDTSGKVVGRVQVTGAKVEDWEAMAVGPCAGGSCVYIADIGDNDAKRRQVTIYRLAEPASATETAAVKDVFHMTYPDGAHDAEALLVAPDGGLFIVTKGETGAVALYRVVGELRPGSAHRLERVGKPRANGKAAEGERITDGTVSVGGRWVALRSKTKVWIYPASEFFAGSWKAAREIDVASFGEPQGEGIAMDAKGTIYLAGEGGSKSQPGTFARLSCGS